jgi:alkylation response protein AidB-like acyl-CoA dehydrogenase
MKIELSPQQQQAQAAFRTFAEAEVMPYAEQHDREERLRPEMVERLAREGLLATTLPVEWGGRALDMITYGLLCVEIGRGCSSVRSLLTVHDMVAHALCKWGSRSLKETWLPKLTSGQVVAALALSEPNVGSDARSVETKANASGDSYLLDGRKKWITVGQLADLFLVVARCEDKPTAFLVERESPGLCVSPIHGMLGLRGSMLAELRMENCRIPKENMVGRVGFGFSHVATYALGLGRYNVAWGSVAIARACLEASLHYTTERKQFGAPLSQHQLIRQMITEMVTNVRAAELLCYSAGHLMQTNSPEAVMETNIAKYFASRAAMKVAADAVQIHGANGCSGDFPVQRHLRDAKIMEIIEGSSQMMQIHIADHGYEQYAPPTGAAQH